jgi:hypothetical protein
MTPEQFCYWLEGFMELEKPDFMNAKQVFEVQRHLKMVFNQMPKKPQFEHDYGGSEFQELKVDMWSEKGEIVKSKWNDEDKAWETSETIPFRTVWFNTHVPHSC